MKHTITAIALMAAGIVSAVPAPYPVTVNSRAQTAPPIVSYRGNESVYRVSFTDGDTESVISAGEIPFMAWATNATAGINSTSSYAVVAGTTGVVDFTFSPSAVNFAPGRYIYEAGVKASNGNNRVYRQGIFQIYGSPIGAGVASVNWTTNMNWATINWQNLPSGFEDGVSLTMWYAWLGTNTYVKTESDQNANARIDTLTNTINAAASAAAYAYSPTNPPPVQAGGVVSVNGGTGVVTITAADIGALTNETDTIALAALAAHAAYWPPNATASSWFAFTTNAGAITITGYDIGGGADVVIPDYINGWPVTEIGAAAFSPGYFGSAITTISGAKNVETIGDSAFYYCVSLASLDLPRAVTIGDYACRYCSLLTSVSLLQVQTVSGFAFDHCGALISLTFSADAPETGNDIFLEIPPNQVTNYVTNPQATGWGATFGGMPVVRLPLYADEMYQAGELVATTGYVAQASLADADGYTTQMVMRVGSEITTNRWGPRLTLPDGIVTNGMGDVTLGKVRLYDNNVTAYYIGGIYSIGDKNLSTFGPVPGESHGVRFAGYLDDWSANIDRLILYANGNVEIPNGNITVTGTVSAASAILRDSGQPVSWELSASNGVFYASTNGVRAYKLTVEAP